MSRSLDLRVDGGYRMSFTSLATGAGHAFGGTSLSIVQEGVPEAIPAEACYLGWQQSLQPFELLVEQETP